MSALRVEIEKQLDGLRLEEGEKKKLLDGAEISFSGRRFYFHSDSTGSTVQN